jgi:phage-related protein
MGIQRIVAPLLVATVGGIALPALAGRATVPDNATYRAECGSCHVAYPPGLLPSQSWQSILAQLKHHFGTDASVDAKTAAELAAYLNAHAGRRGAGTTQQGELPRITQTPFFVREHDEVRAATWKSPAVKSAANCSACHRQAERGDFSERNLRLPR